MRACPWITPAREFRNPRGYVSLTIGIVPRLVGCSLLAILLGVAAVQFWSLRSAKFYGRERAQQELSISLAVLRHDSTPLGAVWSQSADGQLVLGTTQLNGRNDLVDLVQELTGATVTIFLGDTRVATNVRNPDGSRGVGDKARIRRSARRRLLCAMDTTTVVK